MALSKRIFLAWAFVVFAFVGSLYMPHEEFTNSSFVSYSLQALLFIISLHLIRREPVVKNRFIFLNFSFFFGVSFLFHAYNFVREPMFRLFYFQYVSVGFYFFFLAFAIGYLTIDLLFRDFKTIQKYLLTLAVVGGFFAYYYHPYFSDSRHLYTTTEIREWKELDHASSQYAKEFGKVPTEHQLASYMTKTDALLLGRLTDSERFQRVSELYPYLQGSNYLNLLLKPILLNVVYMCVLSVGLILLFFGYQYEKDPPQGAYIEKMMFFFLMFCTLEVFHAWSCIKTIEWQSFAHMVEVGQYLSAGVLACIAVVLLLRLRFITSAYGEFYEHEIVDSPTTITRWRDALDNLVLSHFFNRKELIGRFLVDPKLKTK